MVLELCGGKDAEKFFLEKPATEQEVQIIIKQVILGALALHKAGIYHRDLKPSNWMVQLPSMKLKIIDFGLSIANNSRSHCLVADGFHSPELFLVHSIRPAKMDAWMIGESLYYMFTKRTPFGMSTDEGDRPDAREVTYRISNLIYTIPDHFSPEVSDLIQKILVYEDKRLTFEEMLEHPWLRDVSVPE